MQAEEDADSEEQVSLRLINRDSVDSKMDNIPTAAK